MKDFVVNEYITLRLDSDKTNIYIENKIFNQCKYILLQDLRLDEIGDYVRLFDSVDEQAEMLDHSLERPEAKAIRISPRDEFWAHCSNLQIWAENNYDTRLLHSNLAFPLLKELSRHGDLKAQFIFREEIVKRFSSGYLPIALFLILGGYLDSLKESELELCFLDTNIKLQENILKEIDRTNIFFKYILPILSRLSSLGDHIAESLIKDHLEKKVKQSNLKDLLAFIHSIELDYLSKNFLDFRWFANNAKLRKYIVDTLRDERFHKNYPNSYRKFPFELITLFYELEVPDNENFICHDIFDNIDPNNKILTEFLITEGLITFFPNAIIQKWIFSSRKYTELYHLYRSE